MSKKSRFLARTGLGLLLALCCLGGLGISLLIRISPVSISSPKLSIEQPLGEGEAFAFSYMRANLLRPFELYILDGAEGFRALSQGLMRSDIGPVWSPDGAQLAYKAVSEGATRYHLMDAQGGDSREITPDDTPKELIRWSPDGTRLAYLAYARQPDGTPSNSPTLCITELSTGVTHQASAGNIQDLVWLPDGPALLAVVQADDGVAIEAYAANGSHKQRIAEADYMRDAAYITLAPDASTVAYIRWGTDEDIDTLHIATLDGSASQSVRLRWLDGAIVWSPDSRRIAFVALTDDYEYALYMMEAERAELRELMLVNTGDESGEILPAAPAWSPDGARLAIPSVSSPGGAAVYVMNADGTERRQIFAAAGTGAMIYDLAWRPGE